MLNDEVCGVGSTLPVSQIKRKTTGEQDSLNIIKNYQETDLERAFVDQNYS